MSGRFRFLVLLQVLILVYFVESDMFNSFIKPTKIECFPNPKRFANHFCELKARQRGLYVINMEGDLVQPLRNFSVRFETFKLYNGYRPFIANTTEYFCEYMSGRKKTPLMEITKRYLSGVSNILNGTCPLTGRAIIRGLKYIPGVVPSVIPRGRYKFRYSVIDDTVEEPFCGYFELYLDIFEDRKRNNKH